MKILSQNGEVAQVAQVHQGQLFADVGFSLNQMGWTGVDALVRLLGGHQALRVQAEGVVLHIFTQANSPADGNFNWAKAFPYEQNYKKAWGVSEADHTMSAPRLEIRNVSKVFAGTVALSRVSLELQAARSTPLSERTARVNPL